MSRKYKFHNESGSYFISFIHNLVICFVEFMHPLRSSATVYWLDVFTRQIYFNVLEESIDYCRTEKGMEVFAYCFMQSHVHLIFRSGNEDPSGLIRDFKGFTAKKLIKTIEENLPPALRSLLTSKEVKNYKQNM